MSDQTATLDTPKILKNAGLRVTPQRDAILRFLLTHPGHMSADEIYRSMQSVLPNLSVSTVYNTLKSLSDVGLIREIKFGDAASLFDANTSLHHHMACRSCGKLWDFHLDPNPDLTEIAKKLAFHLKGYHIVAEGTCDDCMRKSQE